MGEVIGFIIGLIIFLIVLVLVIINFAQSPIIYILIFIALIAIIAYFLNRYLENKNSKNNILELNSMIKQYQINKDKLHINSKFKVIIESFINLDSDLLIGENFIWLNDRNLCVYPSYPTIDNYLLYQNIKITEIPLFNLKYERIGKLGNRKFKVNDDRETVVVNNLLNNDTRRTVLTYGENKIVLDYYAYDIIDKIVNNS